MPAPNSYVPGAGAEGAFGPYKYALKELYERYTPVNLTYQDNLFMAMVPKDESFYGASLPIVQQYTNPQNTSSDFTVARLASQSRNYGKSNSEITRFAISRKRKYSFCGLDAETWLATKSDMGAFLDAANNEYSATMIGHMQQLNSELFLDGTGCLSQIALAAEVAVPPAPAAQQQYQFTLVEPADCRRFELNMRVVTGDKGGTGTSVRLYKSDATFQASAGQAPNAGTIIGIDRSNGILTVVFDTPFTAVPNFSNQFIGIFGTMIFGAKPDGVSGGAVSGLNAWLPITAPSSTDSFYGINRSADSDRLSGVRIAFSGGASVLEAAIELERAVRTNGGRPDYFWLNPIKMASLRKSLLNNVLYENVDLGGESNISFKALVLPTDYGQIRVMADPNIDVNKGYMLSMSTWKLYSLGAVGSIVDEDGLTYLRQADNDGVEFRVRSLLEMSCFAVGHNGVCSF